MFIMAVTTTLLLQCGAPNVEKSEPCVFQPVARHASVADVPCILVASDSYDQRRQEDERRRQDDEIVKQRNKANEERLRQVREDHDNGLPATDAYRFLRN